MGVSVKNKPKQVQAEVDHLTVGKSKKVVKAKQLGDVVLTEEQQGTVLLLATVMKQIDERDVKALVKEKEGYRKQLVPLCDEVDEGKTVTLETEDAVVVFSAAPQTDTVKDMNGLIGELKKKIGYDGLLSLLKVSITEAKKYLSEAELAPYLEKVPGTRTLQSAKLKED